MILRIAAKSLLNRRGSALLTLFSIVLSLCVLLSIEHIKEQSRQSFNRTVSGVDLIVGAPTGDIDLLLSSVFHMGGSPSSVPWQSYQQAINNPLVAWSIPIALGDSHQGYSVLATNEQYFNHFRYANKRPLLLQQGKVFAAANELVLGYQVAKQLGYTLGQTLTLSHGHSKISFKQHKQHPFTVVGILSPTGIPVDHTLHIPLAGMTAMHKSKPSQPRHDHEHSTEHPEKITAFFVGLSSRMAVLRIQNQINQNPKTPLLAILPGVALSKLWNIMGQIENLLLLISYLVLAAALCGLTTMLLASMRERTQEIAVLRAIGAGPFTIFFLIQSEALLISISASVLAIILVGVGMTIAAPWLSEHYGLFIEANVFTLNNLTLIALTLVCTFLIAIYPASKAYRQSLHLSLK